MDDPPTQERIQLRKSSFGRTNLFLVPSTVRFREVRCTSTLSRQAVTSVFHPHSSSSKEERDGSACWHCCHPFDGDGFRSPRVYDPVEKVYHVYGWFCSANCAKAYVLEHSTFDRGYQMSVFSRMLRDVYHISDAVVESPPRISLRMFGGPLDIEEFRTHKHTFSVVSPPFVSYCMLVEERGAAPGLAPSSSAPDPGLVPKFVGETTRTVGSLHGFRRPDPTPLLEDELCSPVVGIYSSYLEKKQATASAPSASKSALDEAGEEDKKRKREIRPSSSSKGGVSCGGGLARFKSK